MEAQHQECLKAHNEYRARHGTPPLTLSPKISQVSQNWANRLVATNSFSHSQGSGYGENLYYYQSSNANYALTGREAVESWYNEIKDYNFGRPGFCGSTGHFTQVVWKSTKELGVGIAKSGGKTIVVCNYSPPGNYQGQFPQNVLPRQN